MSLTTDDVPPAVVRPALAPGTVIDGRYRIEARLGAGGAGTVFRCTDLELGAAVALKVLAGDADIDRWRREVALARRITDRNVCRVHDLGDTPEFRFVTMELVEGVGLRDKIGEVSPTEARDLIEQLIAGTAAIHAAGIVHRDLKPENVVVEPGGRAVIVDFGIAKNPTAAQVTRPHAAIGPSANLTLAGTAIGTPRYMSPEQAAGEPVDARSDVWALGLIAHELLTGKIPELGADGPLVAPAIDDAWPGGVAILRRCLALDAVDRFADAHELATALASISRSSKSDPSQRPAAGTRSESTSALRSDRSEQPTSSLRSEPHRTVDLRTPRDPQPVPRDSQPREPQQVTLPRSNKLVFALAAAGAVALVTFLVVRAVRDRSKPDEPAPSIPAIPDAPTSMTQLTTTAEAQWPEASPTSVALDPTAKQFAYTTGDGKLHVRALAGGATTDWPAPSVKPHDTALTLSASRVAGWFSDGALAIVGATTSSLYLIRMRQDGTSDRLYDSSTRFRVAVSASGKIAIADRTSIRELDGAEHAKVASGDRVVAVTWAGDRLAWIRIGPTGDATLELEGLGPLWTGRGDLLIDPLLAAVDDRLVFSNRDRTRTTISSIDPATKKRTVIEEGSGHVGAGTAAKGTLLLVRGAARQVVQIRDRYGSRAAPAHDDNVSGSDVAGWTPDGAAVFRAGEQIVTGQVAGANSKSWHVTPWPGTSAADIPVTVAGPDLLVRDAKALATAWQLARVTPDGKRTKLPAIENAVGLHCASGCVVQQRDGGDTFTEIDPATGTLGRVIYRHPTPATGFALSPSLLVLAGGETVLPVDRATGQALMKPYPASIGTAWHAVALDDAGDLWTFAEPLDASPYRFAKARASNAGSGANSGWARPSNFVMQKADALRWFGEAAIHGVDNDLRIAVETTELRLEIWRADHLAH